jgi:hypothetical protein
MTELEAIRHTHHALNKICVQGNDHRREEMGPQPVVPTLAELWTDFIDS